MDPVKGHLDRPVPSARRQVQDAEGRGGDRGAAPDRGAAHERLDCPVTSCMKPLRLLLVEDSENDATLLIEYLRQGGYEPDYTRVDNEKALTAALDQHDWDLVIADYTMPGFSGTVGARDGARPRPGSAVHFRVRHDRRRDRGRRHEERRRRLHHQEQSQPAHPGDQPRAARCRSAARAIEGRRAHPPPRVLRQPDRSAEPDAVPEPARDGGRQRAAHAQPAVGADHGPRRVQGDQRHDGASDGRCRAARDRAPAAARAARIGYGRAPRRRRVRGHAARRRTDRRRAGRAQAHRGRAGAAHASKG